MISNLHTFLLIPNKPQLGLALAPDPSYLVRKSKQVLEDLLRIEEQAVTVCHQLRNLVNDYLGRNKNISLNALAKRSGVSTATLRRIAQDVTKSEPAPHTILNLVSYIYREKRMSKLLERVDGPLGQLLQNSFGGFVFESEDEYSEKDDLNAICSDFQNYMIYKLAANRQGTTWREIQKTFGDTGVEKAKALISAEFLYQDDGKTIHARDKKFAIDIFTAKKHLSELVQFFRPEALGEGQNLFYSMSESLNQKGIREVMAIMYQAAMDSHKVMNDPKYAGDIPYFGIFLSDILSTHNPTCEVLQ